MMRYMERRKPNRSGFYLWIIKNFLGMDNRFGDLAHDMAIDDRFPEEDSYDAIYDYLVYQCDACQCCINVFKESWAMYRKESAYA